MGDDHWKDSGACADENDSYLPQVVGRLKCGEPRDDTVAYLEEIGMVQMCGGRVATRSRAKATVAGISDYLAELPAGPLKVSYGSRRWRHAE